MSTKQCKKIEEIKLESVDGISSVEAWTAKGRKEISDDLSQFDIFYDYQIETKKGIVEIKIHEIPNCDLEFIIINEDFLEKKELEFLKSKLKKAKETGEVYLISFIFYLKNANAKEEKKILD